MTCQGWRPTTHTSLDERCLIKRSLWLALRLKSGTFPDDRKPAHKRSFDHLVGAGEQIDASFKNGILNATLPKSPTAQQKVRRIAINGK